MRTPLALMAATMLAAAPALAEHLAVVGDRSGLLLHKHFGGPCWQETLPEVSGGLINVNLTAHDQTSLGVEIVFRLQDGDVNRVALNVADNSVADASELDR